MDQEPSITVAEILKSDSRISLGLSLASGEDYLSNRVTTSLIQKPGLLLTAIPDQLHSDRIQILGVAEIRYLNSVDSEGMECAVGKLMNSSLPCVIVTRGLDVPHFLTRLAEKKRIPLMTSRLSSSQFIERMCKFLEETLAPTTIIHGVLLDILGMGVLITGKSGIGKSECALELISKGHRLVADDAVTVKRISDYLLSGTASDIIRYHMEIRGLGIVNVRDLFGVAAIMKKKNIEMVIELEHWDRMKGFDRLGFDDNKYEILGVEIDYKKIPVSPGRSIAGIIEMAVRNHVLKLTGHNPGTEFERKLRDTMERKCIVDK